MNLKKHCLLPLFYLAFFQSGAQIMYRGIVADSVTFNNLTNVYINVKGSHKISVSRSDGSFFIRAKSTDTLIFRMTGYKTLRFPLYLQENGLFILLTEDKIFLQPVTISGLRLYPGKVEERTIKNPTTRSFLTPRRNIPQGKYFSPPFLYGHISLFDYSWKLEKERRKLKKRVMEENKSQTFRQVITNPKVKDIMMKNHRISETTYYHLIEQLNIKRPLVQYFTDPDAIMIVLHDYISRSLKK